MNRVMLVAVAVAAVISSARGMQPQHETPALAAVSVEQEPRHRPVFENAFARVLDVRVPAGDVTLYHTHSHYMAGVTLQSARAWGQMLGAEPKPPSAGEPVGTVFDSWLESEQLPYTHRVGNADTKPFRYLIGEWLASPGADAPKLPDTKVMRMEKESPLFRIYRITLLPGAIAERHQHLSPGFTVQLQDGRLEEEGSLPTAKGGGSGSGAWRWRVAGYSHRLRNAGNTTLEIVEVDWLTGGQRAR